MREVLEELHLRWAAGEAVGLATVVETWRSAPRPPGAAMLVSGSGAVAGSVSTGCVEAAVYELAAEAARDPGRGPVLERYGLPDDDALAVGLTCGGTVAVLVERVTRASFPELGEVRASILAGEPVAVATCADPADARFGRRMIVWRARVSGSFGPPSVDGPVIEEVRRRLDADAAGPLRHGPPGASLTLAVQVYPPKPRLIVFGALDFGAALARAGAFVGFRVTVCDARPVFATRRRLPGADEVVVAWPHRYLAAEAEAGRIDARTALCVLTHDPKFDVPLLEVALRLDVAYVGAMGSRRTHEDRVAGLRRAGLPEAALARLRSPIGLDLGARTPEETAVSIVAEIISVRRRGTGRSLSLASGPIHH